jgi:hypothetical protein
MALEKVISEDKIEIVGAYKAVQSGPAPGPRRWRRAILWLPPSRYHAGQDYSGESAEVQAVQYS